MLNHFVLWYILCAISPFNFENLSRRIFCEFTLNITYGTSGTATVKYYSWKDTLKKSVSLNGHVFFCFASILISSSQEANLVKDPGNGSSERPRAIRAISLSGKALETRLRVGHNCNGTGLNFTADEKFKKRGWGEPHQLGRPLNFAPRTSLQPPCKQLVNFANKTRQGT